jgi:hypothetical protein
MARSPPGRDATAGRRTEAAPVAESRPCRIRSSCRMKVAEERQQVLTHGSRIVPLAGRRASRRARLLLPLSNCHTIVLITGHPEERLHIDVVP